VLASTDSGSYNVANGDFFGKIEDFRVPMKYMSRLFSAGNEELVKKALKKLIAVRAYQQAQSVGNLSVSQASAQLTEAGSTKDEAEAIFRMTALPRFDDRFVLPPYHREVAIETGMETIKQKGQTGLGFTRSPKRGP
jgi:nitrate reductase beta subunit